MKIPRVSLSTFFKTHALFEELLGDREATKPPREDLRHRLSKALSHYYRSESLDEVTFHLTDWMGEAMFLVAAHLYPERFTHKELAGGVHELLTHGADHLKWAKELIYDRDEKPYNPDNFLDGYWRELRGMIRDRITREEYNRWFAGVFILSTKAYEVTFAVTSREHGDNLRRNYSGMLLFALEELCGERQKLRFEVFKPRIRKKKSPDAMPIK